MQRSSAVRAAQASLKAELGRDPRPEEIAEEAGGTADTVELALSVADTVSLEQPIGEDGAHAVSPATIRSAQSAVCPEAC